MALDAGQLLTMSDQELEELFRRSPAGPLPDGVATGTAIVSPGGWTAKCIAVFARCCLWQGKVFNRETGGLINLVSLLSVRGIKAQVSASTSWLDGKDCILIDYSRTSLVARMVRDEIREVAPGLYLGPVFLWKKRTIWFSVDFHNRALRTVWSTIVRWTVAALLVLAVVLALRFTSDRPVVYDSPEDHFKYGSTGGERLSGIPYSVWRVLPELFPEYLPGNGYQSLGFIYEAGKELPIGVSRRTVQGLDRVFLNCAVCHVSTVRDAPDAAPRVVLGMPANTVDLQGFQDFLFKCAADPRFTPQRIADEIAARGYEPDCLNRAALRYLGVHLMRDRLLSLARMFDFTAREPRFGPGRVDTFNPPKALLAFPMDKLPEREWIGVTDFPSIWLQGKRKGMQLHWDGNNTSVEERNRSAAYGTGAFPPSIDRASMKRTEDWLLTAEPPAYPYPVDQALADRGKPLYATYCAACHGASGRDFTGKLVGTVTPIAAIGTDRHRLDSYSYELCADQNTLYAGYPTRFTHFRKTYGYANAPLDGIWLRAPYLHNGSVPTLRDLLEPAARRPTAFWRGNDLYDRKRVGFVSDVPAAGGRGFFRYDTALPGNGNAGHEGAAYGTELSDGDKDALVEYLKTF
jgi:mono/diheme cytochrome c family protein